MYFVDYVILIVVEPKLLTTNGEHVYSKDSDSCAIKDHLRALDPLSKKIIINKNKCSRTNPRIRVKYIEQRFTIVYVFL